MSSVLTDTLRQLGRWRRRGRPSTGSGRGDEGRAPLAQLSAGAFRAAADERLRSLERQLDELKGRVNGLIFLLAGAVAVQVVMRLVE